MTRIAVSSLVLLATLTACERTPEQPLPAQGMAASAPSAATTAQAAGTGKADWQGYGPLQLGIDEEQVRAGWDGELQGEAVADGGCYYLQPTGPGNDAVAFMIDGNTFVRYDVSERSEAAPGGGAVGMDLQQLRARYAQAEAPQPHKYVEGGKVLRVPSADGSPSWLVFELGADGKATAWRVGLPPQVDYVEGCS